MANILASKNLPSLKAIPVQSSTTVENSIIKILTKNKQNTERWNEDIVFPLH